MDDVSVAQLRTPITHRALRFEVNRNPPQVLSVTGASEQMVSFDAAEGLQVDAVPRAYDGRLWVELLVYECSGAERQFIGARADTVPLRPTFAAEFSDTCGHVLAGSKDYAIRASMTGALQ